MARRHVIESLNQTASLAGDHIHALFKENCFRSEHFLKNCRVYKWGEHPMGFQRGSAYDNAAFKQ
jgi:hypothetical protein